MCLLLMPDCWLDVSVRKVLRPAISTQVFFLGFPVSLKQMLRWFPSPSCHYMLLMYPSRCKYSSTASSSCICVKNDCHRVKTQLQLNKILLLLLYTDSLRVGRSGYRIPVGTKFSAPVQTDPGAHTGSYSMGTGSFPGVNWPWQCLGHSPPSSAERKEEAEL